MENLLSFYKVETLTIYILIKMVIQFIIKPIITMVNYTTNMLLLSRIIQQGYIQDIGLMEIKGKKENLQTLLTLKITLMLLKLELGKNIIKIIF